MEDQSAHQLIIQGFKILLEIVLLFLQNCKEINLSNQIFIGVFLKKKRPINDLLMCNECQLFLMNQIYYIVRNITQMAEQQDANIYVVEQVELSSDSEASQLLEDIHDLDDIEDSINDIGQLDKLLKSTLKKSHLPQHTQEEYVALQPKHIQRLQVLDDFIRNFLIKNKMTKTVASFQKQWYNYVQNSKRSNEEIPDAVLENEVLEGQIEELKGQLDNALVLSEKAKAGYQKLLKERDFHKMHHQRVQKEKKKLNENISRLNALQSQYNQKYDELVEKYNFAVKEKSLIKIERDRLKLQTEPKRQILPSIDNNTNNKTKTKYTPFPDDNTTNPYLTKTIDTLNYKQCVLSKSQKGHLMPISTVVFHPKKPIIGTGSDDMMWKIWTVNQSELIMSGEGHKDWVSSMKFHPKGLHIVTGSGDATVKIWDFVNTTCTFTFKDHVQPVWSVDLNQTGDYIASGSMDHSCRLLDINVGKCRSVFRGHVDSVTCVNFQPFSNVLATSSADKTVSLWDLRSGLCTQTFYGHQGSVNGCKFSMKGDKIGSCDSNGVVKVWDIKMCKEKNTFSCEKKSGNCISVDRSGNIFGVGCDGGLIYLFNDVTGEREHILKGHEDKSKVQAIQFDMNSKMIVSGGSDCTYRIWQ